MLPHTSKLYINSELLTLYSILHLLFWALLDQMMSLDEFHQSLSGSHV